MVGEKSGTNFDGAVPDSVRLAELAVAAGDAGFGLSLCFRDYPARTLAALWAHSISQIDPSHVLSVNDPRDLRRFRQTPHAYRLVLFRRPDLYTEAAWALQSTPSRGEPLTPPAIFVAGAVDGDADSGDSLLLRPHSGELDLLGRYLDGLTRAAPERHPLSDDLVEAMLSFWAVVFPALSCARDRAVVRALWVGALWFQPAGPAAVQRALGAYGEVFRLLRSKTVRPADEPFESVAVAMVGRANVYLRHEVERRCGADQLGPHTDGPSQLTRKVLADLGYPRGAEMRALIGWLVQTDRFPDYLRLGLKTATHPSTWPSRDADALADLLLPWSPKQVRTIFDKLKGGGFIEAARATKNGPWVYSLPEVLARPSAAFSTLPEPSVVRAVGGADAHEKRKTDGPVCPPVAHGAGPTEPSTLSSVAPESESIAQERDDLEENEHGTHPTLAGREDR